MFYATAAKANVEANRFYAYRVRKTHEIRYDFRINDPREVEMAEMKEMDAYFGVTHSRFMVTNTPEFIDYQNDEGYDKGRFFAPTYQAPAWAYEDIDY